jgi:hypothetical protein
MSIYGLPVYEEAISATTGTPSVRLGSRRMDSAGNEYIYGYNGAANSVVNPGVPVVGVAGSTGYTFTVTNAASQTGYVMGLCQHATIATGYYGWFGVKGNFRCVPDSSAVSMNAGDGLAAGVDGGFVAAPATLATGMRWGYLSTSGITGYGVNTLTALGTGWFKSLLG